MNQTNLQFKTLLLLLALVTVAFIWILLPFYGAVFWAVILGIIFAPMQRRLQVKSGWNRNLTSLATLTVCLVIAILPVIIISALLVQEGATLYKNVESGKLDVAGYIEQFKNFLPPYFQHLLDRFGMGNHGKPARENRQECDAGQPVLRQSGVQLWPGHVRFPGEFFIMLYLLFSCCVTARSWCEKSARRCRWPSRKSAACNSSSTAWCAPRSRATCWLP